MVRYLRRFAIICLDLEGDQPVDSNEHFYPYSLNASREPQGESRAKIFVEYSLINLSRFLFSLMVVLKGFPSLQQLTFFQWNYYYHYRQTRFLDQFQQTQY